MVTSDGGEPRAGGTFELLRVDQTTWTIRDVALPEGDPRHIVAVITDLGAEGVQVVWTQPTHRPTRYFSPQAVLDEVTQPGRPASGSTRPVPIPHLPPLKRR